MILHISVSETVKNVTTVKNLINTEDFKYILMNLGDKMTQEEIDDMFEEFDFDDDGAILTKVNNEICTHAPILNSLPLFFRK